MTATEANCVITAALVRMRHAPAPVWPRLIPGVPQRHPARPRRPYRPRGQVRPESLALWGVQDAPIPRQIIIAARPVQFRHRRALAGGVAAALAGTAFIASPVADRVGPAPVQNASVAAPAQAPAVHLALPRLSTPANLIFPPAIKARALPFMPASASPPMPAPVAAADGFVCLDCTRPALRLDDITISLQGSGPTLERVAGDIGAMGASAVVARSRSIATATAQVRFYRPQDRDTAQALANRYGAALVDVTWLSDAAPARIDLLLADTPPGE